MEGAGSMKLIGLRFQPRSGFTSGPEAYSLFGAFCWGYRLFFGERRLLDLLERFRKDPPFLISSPILISSEELFFPAPILPTRFESRSSERAEDRAEKKATDRENADSARDRKFFKRLRYIPWSLLEEVLLGRIIFTQDLREALSSWLNGQRSIPHPVRTVALRNRLNRLTVTTVSGALINLPVLQYPPFLVLILIRDPDLEEDIFLHIFRRLLLGGRKSCGMGAIAVTPATLPPTLMNYLSPPAGTGRVLFYTLSPTFMDTAYDLRGSFYAVHTFLGFIENFYQHLLPTIIKERVIYLSSGSLIGLREKRPIYGGMRVVAEDLSGRTDTRVYQYGYAFPLYVKISAEEFLKDYRI